jgi:hypothetical protein
VNKLAVYTDDGAIFELVADASLSQPVIKFGDSLIRCHYNPIVPDARELSNIFVNYFKCELYYVKLAINISTACEKIYTRLTTFRPYID